MEEQIWRVTKVELKICLRWVFYEDVTFIIGSFYRFEMHSYHYATIIVYSANFSSKINEIPIGQCPRPCLAPLIERTFL